MIRRPLLLLTLLAAGVFVLYVIRLGNAPVYLHEAEVLFALHAHSIATTLHDTNGRLLPLYFQMPEIGENVWFHPAIVYAMAPILAMLPLSEAAIRLPSAIVGTIDVVLVYFIAARLLRSERWGLAAAGLLALTPSHFIHSRIAMDYLYPVPFVLAWLLCLLIFLDGDDLRLLFAATSFLGLGIYTYIASVIMMPVYLLLTLAVVWRAARRPARPLATAVAGFAWPLTLLAWVVFHPQVFDQTVTRYGVAEGGRHGRSTLMAIEAIARNLRQSINVAGLARRASQYWSFFDPAYLFLTGGYANVVNSTRHVGVFPISFIALVPAGASAFAWRGAPTTWIVLAGFAIAPLAACIAVPEPYAIDRELALLPFGALIAAAGLRALAEAPLRGRRIAAAALAVAVPVHFALFLVDYYRDYPPRAAFWFNWNRRGAFERVIAEDRAHPRPAVYLSTHHISFMEAYWKLYLIEHAKEDLLRRTVFFDSQDFDVHAVAAHSLLVVGPDDTALSPAIASGTLRVVASIPEPGNDPFFSVLEATGATADMQASIPAP